MQRELGTQGLISPPDLSLVNLTDDVDEAVDTICRFYRSYHSMRFVGRRLVLRMQHEPSATDLAELNQEFGDLLEDGQIERVEATQPEIDDDDVPDLPRLAMAFDRRQYGRLRQLVDRLNDLP